MIESVHEEMATIYNYESVFSGGDTVLGENVAWQNQGDRLVNCIQVSCFK